MSKCSRCNNKSVILTLSQNIGLNQYTLYICDSCAVELGIRRYSSALPYQVQELFTGMLHPKLLARREKLRCGKCKTTYADFVSTGLLGCSHCYEVFNSEIKRLHKEVFADRIHAGRLPQRLQRVRNILVDKPALKNRLKKAIEREDYEQALQIQRDIQELEDRANL